MTIDEALDLVALTLRNSALPSANGVHKPNRYQASVTASDMATALKRAGLISDKHAFYAKAMPPKDSTEKRRK